MITLSYGTNNDDLIKPIVDERRGGKSFIAIDQ